MIIQWERFIFGTVFLIALFFIGNAFFNKLINKAKFNEYIAKINENKQLGYWGVIQHHIYLKTQG